MSLSLMSKTYLLSTEMSWRSQTIW